MHFQTKQKEIKKFVFWKSIFVCTWHNLKLLLVKKLISQLWRKKARTCKSGFSLLSRLNKCAAVNLVVGGVEILGTVGTKSWWNRIPINWGENQPKWKIDPKKEEYPKMGNCTNLSVQILLKFVYQLKIETQFQAYPWCGYRHLLFDTIVKPLDREKEKNINGAFLSRDLRARKMVC